MHIIWVNDHADFTGGCEQYIFETASRLRERGITCTLFYTVGCPISPAFTNGFDGAYPMVELERQIESLDPDVIYIHTLGCLESLKQIADSAVTSVRFFHDHKLFCLREHKYTAIGHNTCSSRIGTNCYGCLGFVNRTEKGIRFRSVASLENELKVNRGLDYFVVGSSYMADHLELHDFDSSKILTAPLFISSEHQPSNVINFPPKSDEFNVKKLLFVGQLVRGKGIDTLLQALSNIDAKFVLQICGTGKMEASYRQMVIDLGIEDNVVFAGKVTKKELSHFYHQSDVVLIPARSPETFCLVGIEALLHGKPVIASNVGGMSDWFKPQYNGLPCQPNDPVSLQEAINILLTDELLYSGLIENIKSDDYSQFLPAHHINLLENTFRTLLEVS